MEKMISEYVDILNDDIRDQDFSGTASLLTEDAELVMAIIGGQRFRGKDAIVSALGKLPKTAQFDVSEPRDENGRIAANFHLRGFLFPVRGVYEVEPDDEGKIRQIVIRRQS